MAEALTNMAPANWQVTATTIECEYISEYVTTMVNKDWSCKCTWWAKYKKAQVSDPNHKLPKGIKEKSAKCLRPDCQYVIGYRDKLIEEEAAIHN
jgi:hypothetical protein